MTINIKITDNKLYDNTFNNYMTFEIYGSKINHVIVNTIRRTILEMIPTYAFDRKDIIISKNSSIYNNDQMTLRLSQIPVIKIYNNIENLNKIFELEYESTLSMYEKKLDDINIIETKNQLIKLEKAQNFIIYIDIKNISGNDMIVTTSDKCVIYKYKGETILSPYKNPICLIKLKDKEEFQCIMTSSLHIGMTNSIFIPTAACYFDDGDNNDDDSNNNNDSDNNNDDDIQSKSKNKSKSKSKSNSNNKKIEKKDTSETTELNTEISTDNNNILEKQKIYTFTVESLKQLSEIEIIIRACTVIVIKLNNFIPIITNKIKNYKSNEKKENDTYESKAYSSILDDNDHTIKGIIIIENESHTYGNLISRLLQDHKNILFAACKIDNLLKKEATLAYKTDGTHINNIFEDIIKEAIHIFNTIRKQFEDQPDLNCYKN